MTLFSGGTVVMFYPLRTKVQYTPETVVIRNEELECFILGFGLELPDEGLGRPIALTALWLAVKRSAATAT